MIAVRCLLVWVLVLVTAGCTAPNPDLFPGYAEADFTYVASPLGGRLMKLSVARGQAIVGGDLLFQLDDEEERQAREAALARLHQAESQLEDLKVGLRPTELAEIEANLKEAQRQLTFSQLTLQRNQALFQGQVLPKESLDQAEVQVEVDQARVAAIEAALQTANLGARRDDVQAGLWEVASRRATLAGIDWQLAQKNQRADQVATVHDTFYTEGEYVPPGRPVLALLVPDQIHIRFFIPEPDLGRLRLGAKVSLACDGCAEDLRGTVTYISQQAEYTPPVIFSRELRADLVFLVEVTPDPGTAAAIHPGQPFEVRLSDGAPGHD